MLLNFTSLVYSMSKHVCETAFVVCMLLIALSPLNWLLGLREPHIIYYLVLAAKVCGVSFVIALVSFLANRFIAMLEF